MGGGKAVAVAVLILVILAAVIIIVRQQTRTPPVPDEVLDRKVELITASQPYETKMFTNRQIVDAPRDPTTGYYKIEGKTWAGKLTCVNCGKVIPAAPMPVAEAEGGEAPLPADYTCPLCGKSAMEPEAGAVPPRSPE